MKVDLTSYLRAFGALCAALLSAGNQRRTQ
jgi:hypothetical protein